MAEEKPQPNPNIILNTKSLIETLHLISKVDKNQKLYSFALIKEEGLDNIRKWEIRSSFITGANYETAINTLITVFPELIGFKLAHYTELPIGEIPKESTPSTPAQIPAPQEQAIEKNSDEKGQDKNNINLIQLLRDSHAQGATERGVFNNIIERMRNKKTE